MLTRERVSLEAQLVKNLPARQETPVQSLGEGDGLPTLVFLDFPGGSAGKESACNAGDLGLSPGLGRSPGEGKGYSLQYSGLKNSKDCIVHGVAKSRTRLSDCHFHTFITINRLEPAVSQPLCHPMGDSGLAGQVQLSHFY